MAMTYFRRTDSQEKSKDKNWNRGVDDEIKSVAGEGSKWVNSWGR